MYKRQAKGGLKMLTKNICSEYGQYNIHCNGLGPGYIETPQTAPLREIQPDGSKMCIRDRYLSGAVFWNVVDHGILYHDGKIGRASCRERV